MARNCLTRRFSCGLFHARIRPTNWHRVLYLRPATDSSSVRSRAVTVVSHLLCGFGLLPVLVFVVGEALVGPYQGPVGLASFMGALYADLGNFQLGAWLLVATPSIIVGVWHGTLKLQRHLLDTDSAGTS